MEPTTDREAQWLGEDIHEYDGQQEGRGWRLKVDQLTMHVLVCARDLPCPFNGHPDDLPGEMRIAGERWVSEFVAVAALCAASQFDRMLDLDEDICCARIGAAGWLHQKSAQLQEMARSAQQRYEDALRGLHETRQQLGLAPPGPPPEVLPS